MIYVNSFLVIIIIKYEINDFVFLLPIIFIVSNAYSNDCMKIDVCFVFVNKNDVKANKMSRLKVT